MTYMQYYLILYEITQLPVASREYSAGVQYSSKRWAEAQRTAVRLRILDAPLRPMFFKIQIRYQFHTSLTPALTQRGLRVILRFSTNRRVETSMC
jgi:hypothetical protein